MPKNIVICFDGTNNKFGSQNTNVVRLVQLIERNPSTQRLYYDPGVGTLPEPGVWSALGKRVSEIYGLAFGRGLSWKVQEAYSYLMDFWEPGDKVLVFGFSRGAYSARVLAGMLHTLGLLPRGNHNLVPYVMNLYGAMRGEKSGPMQWTSLCEHFRWTFARVVPEDEQQRHFHVHYLGLWDTVSSVGWVWDPAKYPFTACNPSVHAARHAVSIDERRWFFRQNRMKKAPDQQLDELWFPGVHSDIGGGYPHTEGALWREPFEWILRGAEDAGLKIDETRRTQILPPVQPDSTATAEKHESLKGLWWPAEFFPKWQWSSLRQRTRPAIGGGRFRAIANGALLHRSALVRLRKDATYRPNNLAPGFVDAIRSQASIPDSLAYDAGQHGQRLGVGMGIVAVAAIALAAAVAGMVIVRGGNWIAERSNVECREAQTGPVFETRRPCWDLGRRVKPGTQYRVRLTVGEPWVDLSIPASPSGFGASQMTLVGNLFTPLRRSFLNRWFKPMVKIVPAGGGFTLVPLEMQRTAAQQVEYIGEFTASDGGRVFMFVNDVILPPWIPNHRYFYDNNKGTVTAIDFEETSQ
jgi:uncharacterized protein (DUF2235 family)